MAAIAKALEILKEEAVKEALLQDTAQCSQQLRVEGPQGVSFRVFLVSFGAVFQGGVSEHEGGQFRIKPGSVSVPCRGSVSGSVCRKLPIPALKARSRMQSHTTQPTFTSEPGGGLRIPHNFTHRRWPFRHVQPDKTLKAPANPQIKHSDLDLAT